MAWRCEICGEPITYDCDHTACANDPVMFEFRLNSFKGKMSFDEIDWERMWKTIEELIERYRTAMLETENLNMRLNEEKKINAQLSVMLLFDRKRKDYEIWKSRSVLSCNQEQN